MAPANYLGFMKTDIRHPVHCVGYAPDIPDSKKQVLSLVTAFIVPGKFSEFDSTALPILHEQQGWKGLTSISTSTKDYLNVQQVQIYANMSTFLAYNEARGKTLGQYARYFTAQPLYDVGYVETDHKWGCRYNCLWGDFKCEYGLPIGEDANTWDPLCGCESIVLPTQESPALVGTSMLTRIWGHVRNLSTSADLRRRMKFNFVRPTTCTH